jgi:hypothetical protein
VETVECALSRMDAAKVRRFGDQSHRGMIVTALRLTDSKSSRQAPPPLQSIRLISVIRGAVYFGAREATIFSKRGWPRSGSQTGSSFKAP